ATFVGPDPLLVEYYLLELLEWQSTAAHEPFHAKLEIEVDDDLAEVEKQRFDFHLLILASSVSSETLASPVQFPHTQDHGYTNTERVRQPPRSLAGRTGNDVPGDRIHRQTFEKQNPGCC